MVHSMIDSAALYPDPSCATTSGRRDSEDSFHFANLIVCLTMLRISCSILRQEINNKVPARFAITTNISQTAMRRNHA